MSTSATDRLSRLLAMVPWLLRRQGIPLAEAAHHFSISQDQLVKDLKLLFVCGTPGHFPDDLIEADWESGEVFVGNAEEISRPIRLSSDEATVLLASLRALAEVPGLHDRGAIDSAMAKLATAQHGRAPVGTLLSAHLASPSLAGSEDILSALRAGLATRKRVRLMYLVPRRDETTEREVDPWRLFTSDGQWYLEAWCHRAQARRTFRIDRILDAEVLAQPVTITGPEPTAAGAQSAGSAADDQSLFTPSADDPVTRLELAASARWVVEYYPVTVLAERGDGTMLVELRVADLDWLTRFVLPFAGAVRIVEPPAFAAALAQAAGLALARYQAGASTA